VGQGQPSGHPIEDVFVKRLAPTGAEDTAFGSGGVLYFPVGTADANPRAAALAASGKLYIVGYTSMQGSNETDIFVARIQ
jgi:hypothetical protein